MSVMASEEDEVAKTMWLKSIEAALKSDAWGQVVEAVEAYERCVCVPMVL